MIKLLRSLLLLTLLLPLTPLHAAPEISPVGIWRTYDDTGHPTGRVQIWQDHGLFYGRIVAIDDPAKRDGVCGKCTGDLKNQPAIGLQFMRGLKPDGDHWDGGTVVDPETGGIYRASMRLTDGGEKLVVRGFIGISLFGRSQTWVRVR